MRKFIAAAGATLLTGGLFAQTVTRDYDHSVDFSSLKKFGWIQRDTLPISRADSSEHDPAADAALNRLILDSLKSHLEKKGFVLDEESPDFLVGYIGVSKYSLQSAEFGLDAQGGPDPSYSSYGHWRPFYQTGSDSNLKREGTLMIDFVDPDTNKLMWRGTARDTVNNPKKSPKKVENAIKKLINKFPPR